MPSVIHLFPNQSIGMRDRARACEHSLRRIAGLWLGIWQDRITYRRMLREELLPQPDSVLADAGLKRSAVLLEVSKPFWRA